MFAILVYVLTALAAVDVVLTRLRLRGSGDNAGRLQVAAQLLTVHTGVGAFAWVLWVVFLIAPEDNFFGSPGVGIIALGLWWVTAIAGLLILVRWLPARGKHADTAATDSWSQGPGLSMLAHIGLLVGTIIFTIAYLTAVV